MAMELERMRRLSGSDRPPAAAAATRTIGTTAKASASKPAASSIGTSLVFALSVLVLAVLVALTFEEHTMALIEQARDMLGATSTAPLPLPVPVPVPVPVPPPPPPPPPTKKGFKLF